MKVISSSGGKGVSTVTRYISERDRDPEKEGKEKRPLFSRDREGMTYRQADKVLAKGEDAPQKDDVIHIAISLRPGDYERLGATNEDRLKAFMQVTREAMLEVESDLGAKDMAWVAGIHQNRANPHVHVAINKDMTDRETDRPKRVETIPRDMRGNKPVERENERGERSQERAEGEEQAGREERGRGERYKVAHRFDEALEHVAGPVRKIAFRLADREVELRRALVPANREPDEFERKVGRWIMLEAAGRPGDEALSRMRDEARATVREIDRATRINGLKQVAAYIGADELKEALDKGQLTALKSNGQKHTPYDGGELDQSTTQRDPVLKERTILGRELTARFRSEYFSAKVDACEEQKGVRRYTIHDASLAGLERKSSAADIEQRAAARGQRAAATTDVKKGSERREIKVIIYKSDVSRHAPNMIEIEEAHSVQLAKLTGLRDRELDVHDRLLSQKSSIERSYRASGDKMPNPIVPRPMLDELHEQAVEQRDFARITLLNDLRTELAQEFGGHARNDHSAARLGAQTEIAQHDLRVSEQRAASFEKSAHLRKWEIGEQKLSLSDVDKEAKYRASELEFQERRAVFYDKKLSFWGSFSLPSVQSFNPINSIKSTLTRNPFSGIGSISFGPTINPLRRAEYREQAQEARAAAQAAQEKIEQLRPVRETIVERIEARRVELAEGVARDRNMADTLTGMRAAEVADRQATGRTMPEPRYKGWELRRLEADAGLLRDGNSLKSYEQEIGPGREGFSREGGAARAFARELHAEIAATEVTERLASFTEHRDNYPLGYRDGEGNLRTGTLSEVKPHSVIERLTQFLTESADHRELRETLEHAGTETYNDLIAGRDQATGYFKTVQSVANEYRAELRERDTVKELPKPEFTRKELADIERYGEALTDHAQHQHYQDFVREVIEQDHVGNHPVGQSFSDLSNSKLGSDPEPEKSWRQTLEPATPTMSGPPAPEQAVTPGNTIEITGASAELEAGGGLAALL
jgi:hypothetical protein